MKLIKTLMVATLLVGSVNAFAYVRTHDNATQVEQAISLRLLLIRLLIIVTLKTRLLLFTRMTKGILNIFVAILVLNVKSYLHKEMPL